MVRCIPETVAHPPPRPLQSSGLHELGEQETRLVLQAMASTVTQLEALARGDRLGLARETDTGDLGEVGPVVPARLSQADASSAENALGADFKQEMAPGTWVWIGQGVLAKKCFCAVSTAACLGFPLVCSRVAPLLGGRAPLGVSVTLGSHETHKPLPSSIH